MFKCPIYNFVSIFHNYQGFLLRIEYLLKISNLRIIIKKGKEKEIKRIKAENLIILIIAKIHYDY